MTEYETVLFDNDGILVEPPAHQTQLEATQVAFRERGVTDVARRDLLDIVDGVTVERLHEICETYDLDPDRFWEARERTDEQSQLDAFRAGDRDRYPDVAAIADLSGDCGVVSNNHHSTVAFVLDFFELEPLFATYYGREKTIESLRRKKPNTHYIELALADLDAESGLYVGDRGGDVVAAQRAGMDSVLLRRSDPSETGLSTEPTHVVDDLYEVVEIVEG